MDVLRSVAGNAFDAMIKKVIIITISFRLLLKVCAAVMPTDALHYLARMLEGGEDVRFARRIVICAAKDVGNADPQALVVANAAAQAAHFVGAPEAQITFSSEPFAI